MPNTNYPISKYGDYVPMVVRKSADNYKTQYFELYTGANPKLKMKMINISFITFQCLLNLGEQPAIDHHMDDIHGIEDGVVTLTEKLVIEVDPKSVFTLPSLLDIELLGPGKRTNLIKSVFTNCMARGVFKNNPNPDQSYINPNRSNDFMSEIKNHAAAPSLKDSKCI